MIRIPLSAIRERAKLRPIGYAEDCLDAGSIAGDELIMEDKDWRKLCAKYRKPLPGLKEMLADFTFAMLDWLSAGFPVCSKREFKERHDICMRCEYWTGGKCGRCSECGCCTEFKPWVRTATCPENLWPPLH